MQIKEDNEKAIKDKTGLEFEAYLGHSGQQNFRRVPQYSGFKFTEPEKVDLKIWQVDKEHKDIFVPNRKSKIGREISEFLNNGLKSSAYHKVWDILKLPHLHRLTFPFVEITNDIIVIFLGDNQEPKDENVIEITKREFDALLS